MNSLQTFIFRRSVRLSVIDPASVAKGADELTVLRKGLTISHLAVSYLTKNTMPVQQCNVLYLT